MFGQWDDRNERAVGAEARKRQKAKKRGCGPVVGVFLVFAPWIIIGVIMLIAKVI